MATQELTLRLEGITAGDYLTWVRDPEPPALRYGLRRMEVMADPLGDSIQVLLAWEGQAPEPRDAAASAGFPLTPEVVAVEPQRRSGRRRVACEAPWSSPSTAPRERARALLRAR